MTFILKKSFFPPKIYYYCKGYWNNPINQRNFFDKIAKDLKIEKPEDWYKVKTTDITSR